MIFNFISPEEFSHHIDKHPEWKNRLSVAEAAKQMGIQHNEVLQLIGSGRLNAASVIQKRGDQIDELIYVTSKDVTQWIDNKEVFSQIENTAVGFLMSRTQYLQDFLFQSESRNKRTYEGYISVEKLIKELNKLDEPLAEPKSVHVDGMFLMANLLSSGLWDREQAILAGVDQLKDPIQRWLANGFTEWAPSFSIAPEIETFMEDDCAYPFLLAQLGSRDEAFSLPLLISKEKKEVIARILEMQEKNKAFHVKIVGKLYHKNHMSEEEKTLLGEYAYDYCLKIEDDEETKVNNFEPTKEQDIYSGYIWLCLADRSNPDISPKFDNTYYVWVHANLSNQKTIDYATSTLQFNIDYLSKKVNPNLKLFMKSMAFACEEEPQLQSEKFYDWLMNKADYFGRDLE